MLEETLMKIPEGGRGILVVVGALVLVVNGVFPFVSWLWGETAGHLAIEFVWWIAAALIVIRFTSWSIAGNPNGRSYAWAAFGPVMIGLTKSEGVVLLVLTILMAWRARRKANDTAGQLTVTGSGPESPNSADLTT
jgi:hypothetical protein